MQTVNEYFGLLQHKIKINIPGAEILNPCTNLNTKYPKVVSPRFPCQLLMQSSS
jgi:hypothetical protein